MTDESNPSPHAVPREPARVALLRLGNPFAWADRIVESLRRVPVVVWIGVAILGPTMTASAIAAFVEALDADSDGVARSCTTTMLGVAALRGTNATVRWLALGGGGFFARLPIGMAMLFMTWIATAPAETAPLNATAAANYLTYVGASLALWGILSGLGGERDARFAVEPPRRLGIRHALLGLAAFSLLAAFAKFILHGQAFDGKLDFEFLSHAIWPIGGASVACWGFDASIRVAMGRSRRRIFIGCALLLVYFLIAAVPTFSILAFASLGGLAIGLVVGQYVVLAIYYEKLLFALGYRAMNSAQRRSVTRRL